MDLCDLFDMGSSMKPTITPKRLYNNADMQQVRDLNILPGIYRLISLLEEAKSEELNDLQDWELIKAQQDAIHFWHGIIAMVTTQKDEGENE